MDARRIVLAPDKTSDNGQTPGFTRTGFAVSAVRTFFRALGAISPDAAARLAIRLWFTPPRPRISDASKAFLASGEKLEVKLHGSPVAAWSWGSGPAVFLMHGWGGYAAQMQSFVEPLVKAGFRAVAFDGPSHGASGASRFGARQSTFFEFRDALFEIERLVAPAHGVIAHSGGCTAIGTAIRAGWKVPGAVLISPMASPLAYQRMFQQALGLTDDILRRFHDRVEEKLSFRWEDLEMPRLAKELPTPPVLVIHDRDDRETSWREGAEIAEAWPASEFMTTTGLGHRRLLRDVAVVDAAVKFIASVALSKR